MAENSGIEWTDATWNPVTGCTKVSQGCKHCYAERDWARLAANPQTAYYGRRFTNVRCHADRLQLPLRWTKPRRVFVNSMSDLFHEDVPFEFIAKVFAVMSVTTRHTYQILTKRPERMRQFFLDWLTDDVMEVSYREQVRFGYGRFQPAEIDPLQVWQPWEPCRNGRGGYDNCGPGFPYENVWLGVSVEDQATADERIPPLLETPAAVRFLSCEPLLGPIDLTEICARRSSGGEILWNVLDRREAHDAGLESDVAASVDWVIVGGESGPGARPMHPDWARSLRDQCQAAGVPFHFKQWGEWFPGTTEFDGSKFVAAPDIEHDPAADQWAGRWGFHGWGQGSGCDGMLRVGKKTGGRLLDGRTWDEVPA